MKLKDIEDNGLFTWWTLVDKNGNKITSYENKNNEYSSYVGRKETDKEIYEKYKDCEVLSIYDIDIDINFENNYITVKLNIQEMMIVNKKNSYLKVTKLTTLNGCFFVVLTHFLFCGIIFLGKKIPMIITS